MKLEINNKQAQLIHDALDLYGRLQMGQVDELVSPFSSPLSDQIIKHEDSDKLRDITKELKSELFPDLSSGQYYSIFNKKELNPNAQIGYDIIQVIRHKLAWDNEPKGGIGFHFDTPMQSSKEPLPKIKD